MIDCISGRDTLCLFEVDLYSVYLHLCSIQLIKRIEERQRGREAGIMHFSFFSFAAVGSKSLCFD